MLLIVILLALDTMLVDTGILYIFFRPLEWGIAFVVAFKYGVKDAIVAYSNEKKQPFFSFFLKSDKKCFLLIF